MSARIIKGKVSVMACHAATFENDDFQHCSARLRPIRPAERLVEGWGLRKLSVA
jgi:hypothetical protein